MNPNKPIPGHSEMPKKITLKNITETAKHELKELTGFNASSVVSIGKKGEVWHVVVELLEKEGIPDRMDILGIYEVVIDATGNVTEYERNGLRKRGDTAGVEAQETSE
jgi:hypothetical protein